MRNLNYILLTLLFLSIFSCNKSEIESFDNLIGSWIESDIEGSLITFKKVNELRDNKPGFTFKSPEIFIERKNAGWCGTPPISYANFGGTWTRNDSIIEIEVEYWGGIVDYKWEIVSLNSNKLKIIKSESEYHENK